MDKLLFEAGHSLAVHIDMDNRFVDNLAVVQLVALVDKGIQFEVGICFE